MHTVSNEEMVGVLTADRYRGGYLYSGTEVVPGQFQGTVWASGHEPGDEAGAAVWVREAPLGAVVTVTTDFGGTVSEVEYTNTETGWAYTILD